MAATIISGNVIILVNVTGNTILIPKANILTVISDNTNGITIHKNALTGITKFLKFFIIIIFLLLYNKRDCISGRNTKKGS